MLSVSTLFVFFCILILKICFFRFLLMQRWLSISLKLKLNKKEVVQSKVILPWRWRRLDEYFGSFHFNSWFVLGDRVATLSVCWVNICVYVCFSTMASLLDEVKWEFQKFQYSCFVDKIEKFIIKIHDSLAV